MTFQARFKTAEGMQQYQIAYAATLALWPVPHEEINVETTFGSTHINVAGSSKGPPLILLHGAQVSSTVWYPTIEPLARHFRVYAPDVVDQTGLSAPTRKLPTPQDNVGWLTELLDALKLERVPMVGHSNGCWQILNLAKVCPQRLTRIALLSPGPPFAAVNWQMLLWALPIFIKPTRQAFYKYFQNMTTRTLDTDRPDPLIEQMMTGALTFTPEDSSMTMRANFTDYELRQIDIPTLLLIGDRERVTDPRRVLARARRLMPRVEAEMIRSAGHLLPIDQADEVNTRLLKFLTA